MSIEGLNINISPECGLRLLSAAPTLFDQLRYFDTVFGRPFRCFSITLTAILSFPIATKCSPVIDYELKFVEMLFLVEIDITMTTINKKTLKSVKSEFCAI